MKPPKELDRIVDKVLAYKVPARTKKAKKRARKRRAQGDHMKRTIGWHFLSGDKLRDGTTAPKDGEWLAYTGPLVMCDRGLHFSKLPHEALQYAPGATLCLVEVGGTVEMGDDKGVCSKRRIVARMDATELLRFHARMCALSVSHLWAEKDDPQDTVLEWLMTGDEALRDAARDAARGAARDAARGAARDAAWDAARGATWGAARGAARDAAWGAARDAARGAAWDAAWGAAWGAAWDALNADFNALVYEAFAEFL